jgi:spore coat protein CotH
MGPVPPERPAPGAPDAAGRGQTPTPPPSAASDELYDPEKVPRFDIELPAASVTALGRDPRQYVTGTFRYGNETISNVGIRLKGEATLRPLTRKAPFKIKFDEFVPDQRFRGLARMTLNNVTEDATFIAERLAYHAFRAAKLPAPRASSALVFVNGQPYGLYANVETEDKTFLARWFASNDGNLYEEGQKDFLPGNEATFELETNETRNDRSDLGAFIAALGTARPASFLADLSATLDTAHFLKFTAVEALVNQWDMYAYTRFYPNNFRLYADPTTRKLVFLPWGMDMSLKDFRGNGDHIGVFTVGRENNAANGRITGGVVFQRCLTSPSCKATYSQTLREMLAAFEALRLDELAERYHAQVRPHVMADPRKEVTVAEFERMHQTMVRIIRERPARVRAELGNN